MKHKRLFLPVLLILFLAGCQQKDPLPASGEYQPGMGWYDRTFVRLMEKWEIPGGALAVVQDGELKLARGYGYADQNRSKYVQPDSLFRIASISKPITAAAVLRLVDEGILDLDAPAFGGGAEAAPGRRREDGGPGPALGGGAYPMPEPTLAIIEWTALLWGLPLILGLLAYATEAAWIRLDED